MLSPLVTRHRGWTVTRSLTEDAVILRGRILDQPERIVLKIETSDPRAFQYEIDVAIYKLTEQRLAAVGPEFHMATQLAERNFAQVDPYGRPA